MRRAPSTANSKDALPPLPVLNSGEVFETCIDIPLKLWVKINHTKNLRLLIISGDATPERLEEVWQSLTDEFRQMIENIDADTLFEMRKNVFVQDRELLLVIAIVNQLRISRNEFLIEQLQNYFDFRLKYVDLNADLDRTILLTKNREIQLRADEKEFNDLNDKMQANKQLSEFEIIEQLAVLSESQGHAIPYSTVTVAEYVAFYNGFKAKIAANVRKP